MIEEEEKPNPFLSLPGEIRNAIYDMVFPFRNAVNIHPGKPPKVHHLLQVSRQIRNEARPVYYHRHWFTYQVYTDEFPVFSTWLHEIVGPHPIPHFTIIVMDENCCIPFRIEELLPLLHTLHKWGMIVRGLQLRHFRNGCRMPPRFFHGTLNQLCGLVIRACEEDWTSVMFKLQTDEIIQTYKQGLLDDDDEDVKREVAHFALMGDAWVQERYVRRRNI